jgi:hypothetical protein
MINRFISRENIFGSAFFIILLIGSLLVNWNNLPIGYELPKVIFMGLSSIFLIVLATFFVLIDFFNSKEIRVNRSFIVLIILLLLYIISSARSEFPEISINGNSFRYQGLIFYSLITIASYVCYRYINRKTLVFVFAAIYLSTLIHSVEALSQLNYLSEVNPDLIAAGYYINGYYGQANFFSTHLILGIISALFLLEIKYPKKISKYIKVPTILSIPLILFALFISYSKWGWVTFAILVLLLFGYKLFQIQKQHRNLRLILTLYILIFFISSIAIIFFEINHLGYNLRTDIWQTSLSIILNDNLPRILFGYGFDTLAEVFKQFNRFPELVIDRGHNIFIDVIMQTGFSTLGLLLVLITKPLLKIRRLLEDKYTFYLFFTLLIFLFKTFVHEYSAFNFFQFLIILAAALKLSEEKTKNV